MGIHYSILPITEPKEEEPVYEEIDYKGHTLLAAVTEKGYQVERVYSTNPQDFLITEIQPGMLLEKRLIKKNNQ